MTRLSLRVFALAVCVCLVSPQISASSEWAYEGAGALLPPDWSSAYPACGGARQSPINVNLDTTIVSPSAARVHITWPAVYANNTAEFVAQNNGHTLKVSVPVPATGGVSLVKNGTAYAYNLWQYHLHWAQQGETGSENQFGTEINGQGSAAEIHFVHAKQEFASLGDAVAASQDPIALLVVSVQIKEGAHNAIVDELVRPAGLTNPAQQAFNTSTSLLQLLPDSQSFLSYEGSLTTPPCAEVVQWILLSERIEVSMTQLDALRALKNPEGHSIDRNLRPIQPLNSRSVFASTNERSAEYVSSLVQANVDQFRFFAAAKDQQ